MCVEGEGHKRAVRVFRIIAEGHTLDEAMVAVESSGGREEFHASCFQGDAFDSPRSCVIECMEQYARGDASAPAGWISSHALQLFVAGFKFGESYCSHEAIHVVGDPQPDTRVLQSVEVESMLALGWCGWCDVVQVRLQEQRKAGSAKSAREIVTTSPCYGRHGNVLHLSNN